MFWRQLKTLCPSDSAYQNVAKLNWDEQINLQIVGKGLVIFHLSYCTAKYPQFAHLWLTGHDIEPQLVDCHQSLHPLELDHLLHIGSVELLQPEFAMIFPNRVESEKKIPTRILSEYKKKTAFSLQSIRNFYFIAIFLLGLWGWSTSAFVHHSWSHVVTRLSLVPNVHAPPPPLVGAVSAGYTLDQGLYFSL